MWKFFQSLFLLGYWLGIDILVVRDWVFAKYEGFFPPFFLVYMALAQPTGILNFALWTLSHNLLVVELVSVQLCSS